MIHSTMPTALKRKGSPGLVEEVDSPKRRFAEVDVAPQTDSTTAEPPQDHQKSQEGQESLDDKPTSHAARFAALKARNAEGRKSNFAATKTEAQHLATDTKQLTALHRKRDVAAHKLLKADVEAAGDDFERKRAWDWTIEESEKWDERMAEKARRKKDVSFQDYRHEASKVYDKQMERIGKELGDRKEAYQREKREAIEKAVQSGGLEIVETAHGELIAVDKDGTFYSTADAKAFENKPDREAVDKLVEDIRKAEEIRLKKRRDRGRQEEDGDVTYINEKNKQFNQKLARFYNKYTSDIRESFERGTAI